MNIELRAGDGHSLSAYVARPAGTPAKAVVVIQEIFGVNSHIRSVADGYARDGFLAIAPALFDRVERNVELAYVPPDTQRGMKLASQISVDTALLDVGAALDDVTAKVGATHAGVVGFCWGGTLAWLTATRLRPAAAVGYYGGRIGQYASETPRCPVMLHFGSKDAHIPASEIDAVRNAHRAVQIFLYDAGHGFNCDQRKDYNPDAAALARERTLKFFNDHL